MLNRRETTYLIDLIYLLVGIKAVHEADADAALEHLDIKKWESCELSEDEWPRR